MKFSNLSNRHACEPKIVPEVLFPVRNVIKILVLFRNHFVKKSAYFKF